MFQFERITYLESKFKAKELQKLKIKALKLEHLKSELETAVKCLGTAVKLYKDIADHTEYWERKYTYDFDFKGWNTIRKVNGHLTRYYNEILRLRNDIRKTSRTINTVIDDDKRNTGFINTD